MPTRGTRAERLELKVKVENALVELNGMNFLASAFFLQLLSSTLKKQNMVVKRFRNKNIE